MLLEEHALRSSSSLKIATDPPVCNGVDPNRSFPLVFHRAEPRANDHMENYLPNL